MYAGLQAKRHVVFNKWIECNSDDVRFLPSHTFSMGRPGVRHWKQVVELRPYIWVQLWETQYMTIFNNILRGAESFILII